MLRQRSIDLESQHKISSSELTVLRSKIHDLTSKNSHLAMELESALDTKSLDFNNMNPNDIEGGGFQPNAFDDNFKDGKSTFSTTSMKVYISQLKGPRLAIAVYVVILHLVILRSVLFASCL